MKLSDCHQGTVVRIINSKNPDNGLKGIVTSQGWPDDRSSGGTVLRWENGGSSTYLWGYEEDPEVEVIGKGRLSIVMDSPPSKPVPGPSNPKEIWEEFQKLAKELSDQYNVPIYVLVGIHEQWEYRINIERPHFQSVSRTK